MAQAGYTPIQLYYSTTASAAPVAGNLNSGELAINLTDGKLFYKDNGGSVQVIGWKTVPATAGGTGQTSYAVGDILYANTTTSLAKLADVATGNALISGGVGVAPSWGKIDLTTHVSGVLPVANGGTGQSSFVNGELLIGNTSGNTLTKATLTAGSGVTISNGAGAITISATGTGGSVTSVSFTGGIVSVANPTTTPALTVAGTSGGIPYFSSASTWASSAALAANALVVGGGAGAAPSTITTGTGVVTALGVNTGTAGAFVVNGGALGTPSSGTVTNLTGTASININGTVGATTPTTGAFTTLSADNTVTFSATTQNLALGTSQTSGTWTAGGASQTGALTLDQSTKTHTLNLGSGATENALTKTINFGTAGVSGSTTTINYGSAVSGSLVTHIWNCGGEKMRLTSGGYLSVSGAGSAAFGVTFSATAMTVNCNTSNVFTVTLTANVTVAPTLSNASSGQTINWFITQDSTGSRTMTWPTSFKWPGGTAGVLSTAANSVDLLTATYRSDTGFWYATLLKAFS